MDDRRRFSAFVAKGQEPRSAILQSIEYAREFLAGHRLDPFVEVKVAILVEELVSNVLRHGGADRDIYVWLLLSASGEVVTLEIEDDGVPFDPSTAARTMGPDPLTGGGIGLAFVQAWGDEIAYARIEDRNTLRLKIRK